MMRNTMIKTSGWQWNNTVFNEARVSTPLYGSTTDGRLYWENNE